MKPTKSLPSNAPRSTGCLTTHSVTRAKPARGQLPLAWWNAGECGAFDLTTAWGVGDDIVEDMVTVFRLATRARSYPDTLGYSQQFEAVVRAWRPELITD